MRNRLLVAFLVALAGTAGAQAQSPVEGRVSKLESEMRAVQRRVFPGGSGALLLPQLEASTAVSQPAGTPAASALADLTSRVSSLESQLTSLTGQAEQVGYRARQVQEQFDTYRRATDARLAALERATPAPGAAAAAVDDEA
ncbi:MAG: tetratricopeptide repeat protein, partial [Sphingomonas bacterium]|nr:tetratricopeptide repeat protein [Sphingomonas bacterium]